MATRLEYCCFQTFKDLYSALRRPFFSNGMRSYASLYSHQIFLDYFSVMLPLNLCELFEELTAFFEADCKDKSFRITHQFFHRFLFTSASHLIHTFLRTYRSFSLADCKDNVSTFIHQHIHQSFFISLLTLHISLKELPHLSKLSYRFFICGVQRYIVTHSQQNYFKSLLLKVSKTVQESWKREAADHYDDYDLL